MCLTAYVALGTGFTMSLGTAQMLRRTLIALCISTLALCVARRMINCGLKKPASHPQPTPAQ